MAMAVYPRGYHECCLILFQACYVHGIVKLYQRCFYCAPVKIAATALVTSSLSFQAALFSA